MLEFFNYLNSLNPLSPQAESALLKVIRAKELRKGQVWLQEGAVCDKLTFVIKGLVKLYFENNDKELVISFAREKEWIVSAKSYFLKLPSDHIIRTIEPTVLLYITEPDVQQLLEHYPEFGIYFRTVFEQQYYLSELHVALMLMPPIIRFQQIEKIFPWMVNGSTIHDKDLAAFLGLTPVCISKYRNRVGNPIT